MKFRQILGTLTLANQLTFLRLVALPFFILSVINGRFDVALGIFVAAAMTDLLDGLIARWFGQSTALGTYLDPAADKLLLGSGFVLLTEYPNMFQDIPMANRIPIWLTTLTITRDVLIVAVAVMLYLAYGETRFRPSIFGKLTTLAEILTVGLFLLFNHLEQRPAALDVAVYGTLVLLWTSGLHYIWWTMGRVRAQGLPPAPE